MHSLRPKNQITIAESMVLIAGAALGLFLLRIEHPSLRDLPITSWWLWLLATQAVLGGSTMMGTVLMLVARFRGRRRWGLGAFAWFSSGICLWLGAILEVWGRLAQSGLVPGTYAEAFRFSQPVLSFCLLPGCFLGARRVPKWWALQGWWPEWMGMWSLLLWSVYVVGVVILMLVMG